MKLKELFEGYGQNNKAYQAWIKACRKVAADAQISGDEHKAQMVDWTSKSNEVVGDWDGKKGVVYEPGSKGKKVVDTINEVTLGSKAHHELIAKYGNPGKHRMSRAEFLEAVKKSTLNQHDCDEIEAAMEGVKLAAPITKHDLQQISAIANVDLDELEAIAGL